MNKIIVINGFAESGKDLLVSTVKETVNEDVNIINVSSVDRIKEIAKESFDWDGVKDEKGRKLLEDLKEAAVNYNNLPLQHLLEVYQNSPKNSIIFYHCREPKQIAQVKQMFSTNCLTLLVYRPEKANLEIAGNQEVLSYKYEKTVNNDSTLDDFIETCKTLTINELQPWLLQQ